MKNNINKRRIYLIVSASCLFFLIVVNRLIPRARVCILATVFESPVSPDIRTSRRNLHLTGRRSACRSAESLFMNIIAWGPHVTRTTFGAV